MVFVFCRIVKSGAPAAANGAVAAIRREKAGPRVRPRVTGDVGLRSAQTAAMWSVADTTTVIPAKAGTQLVGRRRLFDSRWVPAFAGMTGRSAGFPQACPLARPGIPLLGDELRVLNAEAPFAMPPSRKSGAPGRARGDGWGAMAGRLARRVNG